MKFTQNELLRGNTLLNRSMVHLKGNDIALYVHFWAGETSLNDNKPHKHSFYEVCYIAGGNGVYAENGVEYPLSQGDLFLSRPNITHQIYNTSSLYIVFVAFEPIRSQSAPEAMEHFQTIATTDKFFLHDMENSATVRMWEALLLQAQQEYPLLQYTLASLSSALILSFTHLFTNDGGNKSAQLQRYATTLLHRAKLYIRDNLSQSLRLKDVADYLHISGRHLSRLFAEELGRTFTDYVRDERIRQAAYLLSTTNMSIKSISEETGFASVHYFTAVFKEILGITPGEFQRKLIEN